MTRPRYENVGPRVDGLRRCPATAASGAPCTRLGRINGTCWQHVPQELPPPTFDPEGAVLITMKCGTTFRIDPEDYADVARYKWTASPNGYPRRWVLTEGRKPRSIEIQRHILGLMFGDGLVGDHISGDILDNRRANLRAVGRNENAQNCKAIKGVRGVRREGTRWTAYATLNSRKHWLGSFDTEAEAAEVAHTWRVANMPGYVDRPAARRAS